ncbi:hypothetical protein N665_0259s0016 [Sinapis alba]|nr:hypothetical protein N665_0259s0016 [Sinapis alba]
MKVDDDRCQLCGEEAESVLHVLFKCPAARHVWAISGILHPEFDFQSGLIFSNIHYLNDFLFKNIRWNLLDILSKARKEFEEWFLAQRVEKDSTLISQSIPGKTCYCWSPPPQDWLMCNVGFEWIKHKKLLGVAWVVRNYRGVVRCHSRRAFSNVGNFDEVRAEGPKSKAAKKREEEAEKKAESGAKKAETRRLAEQEKKELEKALKNPDKKVNRVSGGGAYQETRGGAGSVGEESGRIKEEADTYGGGRGVREMVLVSNTNRDDSLIEAHTVDEALAKMTVADNFPEKRLKASFKAYEEAEMPRLKEDKPGLTHTQYKDLIWKMWKKSPDNPLKPG